MEKADRFFPFVFINSSASFNLFAGIQKLMGKLLFVFRCIDIDFCMKIAKGSFSAKCTNNRPFEVFFFILKFDDIRSDGVLLFVARSVGTLD